jgi:bifunctional non-homologous end joining protein LigD
MRRTRQSNKLEFTSLDRIVFPATGYTKGDVLDYYNQVSDFLLPHLRARPITIERFPEGVKEGAQHFWQKNTPAYYPAWVPRAKLPTEKGKTIEYTLVNDLPTLLYLANQNAVTFHIWFSRMQSLDQPDFVLFDIDPHQSTFANAIKVARKLHDLLDDEEGVANYLKTSGKTGLHVMTPWRARDGGFDEARSWAEGVARRVAAALPDIATVERTISRRGNRVYVDAMQNAKGKHAVPPYTLRATPQGTVSMPLEWKELTAKLSPKQFDMKTSIKRIARRKKDPLAALTGIR